MHGWAAGQVAGRKGGGRVVQSDGSVVLELNGDHVGVSSRNVNQRAAGVYGAGGSATAQEKMKGHKGQL